MDTTEIQIKMFPLIKLAKKLKENNPKVRPEALWRFPLIKLAKKLKVYEGLPTGTSAIYVSIN